MSSKSENFNRSMSYQWRSTIGEKLLKKTKFNPKIKTLSGINVRSSHEKRIADFLFNNNIEFIYEYKLRLGNHTFYPDFFLREENIFIEFFGWLHIPSYARKTEEKIKAYSNHKIKCIYLYLKGSANLENILREELSKHGVLK